MVQIIGYNSLPVRPRKTIMVEWLNEAEAYKAENGIATLALPIVCSFPCRLSYLVWLKDPASVLQ